MFDAQMHTWDLLWFIKQVKTGGPWDYKQKGPQFEKFGNWHYGVVGRAAGIPRNVLLRAAGLYQEFWQSKNYREENGHAWGESPYGDDPTDQKQISNGMNYYDSF